MDLSKRWTVWDFGSLKFLMSPSQTVLSQEQAKLPLPALCRRRRSLVPSRVLLSDNIISIDRIASQLT